MKSILRNGLVGAVLFAGVMNVAMANQVTITNVSQLHKPMTVVYEVAHKNSGDHVVLGAQQTLTVNEPVLLPVDLENFDFAGIVIVSVDGHVLPVDDNQFDTPEQCSLTTDKNHTAGIVQLDSNTSSGGHGSINCSIKGGVFN
jgi:hypothetical protein